jgi:hypothetical protein
VRSGPSVSQSGRNRTEPIGSQIALMLIAHRRRGNPRAPNTP